MDRAVGVEYRRPDDSENVIRLHAPKPAGFVKKVFNFVPVAGVSFRQDTVNAFIRGRDRGLELRRDNSDPDHPNAVAVFGSWEDNGSQAGQLGYLPGDKAARLATLKPPDIGARLEALYSPTRKKGGGIRLSIWSKRGATMDPPPPPDPAG